MSLKGALVDEAMTYRRQSAGAKVNGETPYADVFGTPFKCRISKPEAFERKTSDVEFVQYERDLVLLCAMTDVDGGDIDIDAADRIVIDEGPFLGTYDIVGKPAVIRKKRKQIGWQVDLKESTGKNPVS